MCQPLKLSDRTVIPLDCKLPNKDSWSISAGFRIAKRDQDYIWVDKRRLEQCIFPVGCQLSKKVYRRISPSFSIARRDQDNICPWLPESFLPGSSDARGVWEVGDVVDADAAAVRRQALLDFFRTGNKHGMHCY